MKPEDMLSLAAILHTGEVNSIFVQLNGASVLVNSDCVALRDAEHLERCAATSAPN